FFRISTTALSLGTTGQKWFTDSIALQGTAMLGVGYAAVGTVRRIDPTDRDYHYGVAPQALLALRLILGNKYPLDGTRGETLLTHVCGGGRGGHENIEKGGTVGIFYTLLGHDQFGATDWSK